MPLPAESLHLARIEPVADGHAGRVLTLRWKLLLNLSLLLIPVMMVGLFVPILGLLALVGSGRAMLVAAVAIPVILAAQVSWAGTYPEWPMNQLLVWRLRRCCRRRMPGRQFNWVDTARMVEWVPRENWSATKLDTAKDVMLIEINDSGIQMEGDFSSYVFPRASMIDVEVESIRPTGCFHQLHFVVITVRTEAGPMEFPLAYRDHRLGRLRSRHRLHQTRALCQQIRSIATGGDFSYSDPDDGRVLHAGHLRSPIAGPAQPSPNPYAAPRSI